MRPPRTRPKAGFTLIEAIVVLAVSALTVAVILAFGGRGGHTVLRLGTRALDAADSQLARDTFRSTVENLVVPALTTRAQTEGGLDDSEDDGSLRGAADQLSGQWLAQRTTACGQAGQSGRLTLALTASAGRTVLTCQLDDGEAITVLDLGAQPARFQYSEDGTTWLEAWTVAPGQPVEDAYNPYAELRRVYVRLATDDGQADLVALTTSGRNIPVAGR